MTSPAPAPDLLSLALQTENPADILMRAKTLLENEPENVIAMAAQAVAQQRGSDSEAAVESFIQASTAAMDDQVRFPEIARAAHELGLSETLLHSLTVRANQPSSKGNDWRLLGKFQFFLNQNAEAAK